MKKLAVFAVAAVLAASAFAQEENHYGWYDTSITIGGKAFDFSSWAAYDQTPSDLGYLSDLTVSSVSLNAWNTENGMGGFDMYFRLWDGSGTEDPDHGAGEDSLWLGDATRIEGKEHDFNVSYTGDHDMNSGFNYQFEEGKTYYIDMWAKAYNVPNADQGNQWFSGKDGQNYHTQFTYGADPSAVPEPATMSLLGLGALAMVLRRKLRK